MLTELLITYSTGQQLKANEESFTLPIGDDWLQIPLDVPTLPPTAKQSEGELVIEERRAIEERSQLLGSIVPPGNFTAAPSSSLKTKQFWEGTVLKCSANRFLGKVIDRTNPSNPDEIVWFEFDETAEDDRPLIKPGATFYWTVGTERTPAGVIKKIDMINFRRTPRWTKASIQKAIGEAEGIAELFESNE